MPAPVSRRRCTWAVLHAGRVLHMLGMKECCMYVISICVNRLVAISEAYIP
uniref:Uncharacterized protein n=1 Tax=Parascaris equorum TaxID=6256 RepID=A0A914RIL6_PAREQ